MIFVSLIQDHFRNLDDQNTFDYADDNNILDVRIPHRCSRFTKI